MEPHPFDNHRSTSLSSSFNNFADSDEDQQSEKSSQDEDQQESSGSEFEEQPQKKSGKPVVITLASHLCFQTPTDSLPQHFFRTVPQPFTLTPLCQPNSPSSQDCTSIMLKTSPH